MNFYCISKLSRLRSTFSKIHLDQTFRQVILDSIHRPHYSTSSSTTEDHKSEILFGQNDFELSSKTENINFGNINVEEICGNDPEKIKKLKLFQLEIQLWAQEGLYVPQEFTTTFWQKLLIIPSKTNRRKFLEIVRLKEIAKKEKKIKQQARQAHIQKVRKEMEHKPPTTTASPIEYGLQNTTIFHRIYDTDMDKLYNYKLLQTLMFGPHVLIDCGYEELMTPKDLSMASREMMLSWSVNRHNFYPYNMIFCNLNPNGKLFEKICDIIPNIIKDPWFPFHHTEKHFLDIFPKGKLVYLTPHCGEQMNNYDPSSIYILGAVSLSGHEEPASLAVAKKYGIRTMKFPLDRYVQWTFGSKILPLEKCISILGDLKNGHHWRYAFRDIIRRSMVRKTTEFNQLVLERNNKNNRKSFTK